LSVAKTQAHQLAIQQFNRHIMNSIQNDVWLLKLYLQRFPESATESAINYFEDYLVLSVEYDRLATQLKQLQRDQTFIPHYPLEEAHLNLEQQFQVERLTRFLAQNRGESEFWAITYFHNFLILAEQYQQIEAEFDSMTNRLLNPSQPSLPYFL
jgi:hypothetical protein